MHPIAFQLGALTVRWYGVMAAIGFLVANYTLSRLHRRAGITGEQSSTLLGIALIFGILGARIFYVLQFFHKYQDNLWEIVRIDHGGLVFYGGFLLALAAVVFYAWKKHFDIIRVLDIFCPALAFAHACGRIGCFLNGCCYGAPTTLCWGVTPPAGSELALLAGSTPLHPVQLVEAGENVLLGCLYCYLLKKPVKRGVVTALFLLIYGVLRFFNEMMRGDNVLYWHLTPAQWIGILLGVSGSVLLFFFGRRREVQGK